MSKLKIVLMRHGESKWNKLNQFTGWQDIKLSKYGEEEAYLAAKKIFQKKFFFDIAYTSVLKRAIHTLWIILKFINHSWIPIKKKWQLNERHYGSLEGLNKTETIKKYGIEKVQLWRRSFTILPPFLKKTDLRHPHYDRKYNFLKPEELPSSESLEITLQRVIKCWKNSIFPNFKKNKKILIIAHGNSLRALIKYLSNMTSEQVINLNIPTGKPIIYEFSNKFIPEKYYYL
ncbi:2,3-diphosphoglycerate-dependent phosphoglycerate mutase [Buchnera aphidicola]|uniref:2,3-diphosphoglycerate-dependent phosphoglycerate mutase n=1 Tax=Buchnera aphidicola TaxID=9 RepID=UPI00313CD557